MKVVSNKSVFLALVVFGALPALALNWNPDAKGWFRTPRWSFCRPCNTSCPPRPFVPNPSAIAGNPGSPGCPTCNDESPHVAVGSVSFWQRFGRTPLVAGAPVGRMEIYEIGAAQLPSGADILRYNHPLMRRIVDRDDEKNLVAVEEGNGWVVVYRDGVPVGASTGADLEIRKDAATGLFVEQMEDRTQVFYGADNVVDHLVTPDGVRLDWTNAGLDVVWDGNAIGQVWSKADGLMDVAKLSPSSFRMSWYAPAAVPGTKEDGRYVVSGNPTKTFTFSYAKVGGEHRLSLLEWRNEAFHFDYLWKSSDGFDWTLVRDPDGLALSESMSSTEANGLRTAVRTYSDANGVLRKTTEAYRYGANGATLVRMGVIETNGSDVATWAASRIEEGPAAGRLASTTNQYGGATLYTYDGHGRLLTETTTVYGSLEEVTSYAYETNLVDGFVDRRPRRRTVTRDGVVVSDTAYDYGFAPDGGRLDTVTRSDPASGATLVSSRLYYPVSSTNGAEAGRLHLSVAEDRTATLYSYASTANDGYIRTSTRGYLAEPDASALGADASRFSISNSQSTRTVNTVNFRGDVVREDEYVHTGEGWSSAGWTTYTYNLAHKRTGFADHKGDWEASEWICTGPVWQDLADGTAVTNTFDKAKRISTSTHYTPFGAVTTAYSYDPLGQIVASTISTNGVPVRGTLAAYDARGRRILSVDEQGRTNTVAYSADNRTITRTTQAGAITTTTHNTDGSTATVSGNARPYESRSYGIDSATGLAWTEVRTAQNETADSVLASRTFRNALGQTVRAERPAPNNLLRATLSAYNALGQLVSEQTEYRTHEAPPLTSYLSPLTSSYAYDALGDLVRTTQTSTSGVWRAQSSSSSYALATDGSVWSRDFSISSCSDPAIAALTNRTDRKLAPLSQTERSHVVSYDLRGNATHETESFDRAAARGESITVVPWAVEPSRSIALAGRTIEVVDFASVTNRFDYDALGQRISTTDSLGNHICVFHDSKGNIRRYKDAAGFITQFNYDQAGRRIETTNPIGNRICSEYDCENRLIRKYGDTIPEQNSFDSYGRQITIETTRSGDNWDRTTLVYDQPTGVLLKKQYANETFVSFDYDHESRVTRTTWARGAWAENRYDDWGNIIAVIHDNPSADIKMNYDSFGRLVSSESSSATYRYIYDATGLVTNEISSILGKQRELHRIYDGFGRVSQTQILNTPFFQSVGYDIKGRITTIRNPSVNICFSYSNDSFDEGYQIAFSNTVFSSVLYRDVHRRYLILGSSNLLNSADIGYSFNYEYDQIGRPIVRNRDTFGFTHKNELEWIQNGTNSLHTTHYYYDYAGNWTSNTVDGNCTCYSANELNQYVTINGRSPHSLVYDLDGNLITNGVWSYVFDSENRLVSVSSNGMVVVENIYDAFSRRVGNEQQMPHMHIGMMK